MAGYTVRVPRVRTYRVRIAYVPRTYRLICDVIEILLLEIFYIEGAALDQTSEHGIAAYLHVLAS